MERQIDFLAAYIIPLDLWYILPAPVTTRLPGHVSPPLHGKGTTWEPGMLNINAAQVIGRTWC